MRCQDCCEVAGKCQQCENTTAPGTGKTEVTLAVAAEQGIPVKVYEVRTALQIMDEIMESQDRTAKAVAETIASHKAMHEVLVWKFRKFKRNHKFE